MKTSVPVGLLCLALAGCAAGSASTSVAQGAYALEAGLDTAEKAAIAYREQPDANAAVVAQIQQLDVQAYAAVAPLVANSNDATADELAAAQAAVAAMTDYLSQNGAK
jgi:hypothetical protein